MLHVYRNFLKCFPLKREVAFILLMVFKIFDSLLLHTYLLLSPVMFFHIT